MGGRREKEGRRKKKGLGEGRRKSPVHPSTPNIGNYNIRHRTTSSCLDTTVVVFSI